MIAMKRIMLLFLNLFLILAGNAQQLQNIT